MGKTIVEKIFSKHAGKDVRAGDIVIAKLDALMGQDGTSPLAIKVFEELGGTRVVNAEKVLIVMDHSVPPPNEGVANLHKLMREFAEKFSGREQLAIQEFASALETIPRTLAENAGLDPIDILVELRAAHEQGKASAGVDVFSGKIVDALEVGIIEPLKVKSQAIKSAAEAAEMILRIDDVIAASRLGTEGKSKKAESSLEEEY